MNHLPPVGDVIIWFVVFLFSLSCHESAHAWTSEQFGDDTGRLQGRITLNPIAHIDPIGTLLLPIMGFLGGGMMFGWAKPVQTNPLLWRQKSKAGIMVAAAGPITNFVLATIAFVIIKVMLANGMVTRAYIGMGGPFSVVVPGTSQPEFMAPLATLLSILLILNVTLCVFNFLPVPPLDGSHVLYELLPPEMARAYDQIHQYGFILLLALLWLGVLDLILTPILRLVFALLF